MFRNGTKGCPRVLRAEGGREQSKAVVLEQRVQLRGGGWGWEAELEKACGGREVVAWCTEAKVSER